MVDVATGRWPYKLVVDGAWQSRPGNWSFAFDDYAGNADSRTQSSFSYDSGLEPAGAAARATVLRTRSATAGC